MSAPNPYATSSQGNVAIIQNDPTTGEATDPFFRDGRLLLLNVHASTLPGHCLKTGIPTQRRFELETRFISRSTHRWSFIVFGVIGVAIAKRCWGRPVSIQVPLSDEYHSRRRSVNRKCVAIVLASMLVFAIAAVFRFQDAGILFLGLMLFLIGLILAYGVSRPVTPLTLVRIDGDWVWIDHVHDSVLDALTTRPETLPVFIDPANPRLSLPRMSQASD